MRLIMNSIKQKTFLILLMLVGILGVASAQMTTNLIFQELDAVDVKSNTVVIAGKPYKYALDVKNSSYRFEADAKTAISIRQLKEGEKYHFELMAKGKDIEAQNFSTVIFISKSKPSE
jgi:hypothetical protein